MVWVILISALAVWLVIVSWLHNTKVSRDDRASAIYLAELDAENAYVNRKHDELDAEAQRVFDFLNR